MAWSKTDMICFGDVLIFSVVQRRLLARHPAECQRRVSPAATEGPRITGFTGTQGPTR